ncbi:hypothetical protein BH23GEM3_BH23GEM3_19850 [soil metagenome]
MFGKLLLLFTLVPVIELALLIRIGQRIGTLPTVTIILITGLIGAWLARREGTRTWRDLRGSLAAGEMPRDALLHGLGVFLGGALLITPGVLTDLFGVALLVPFSRAFLVRRVHRSLERRLLHRKGGIEARFWTHDPEGPAGGPGGPVE